jgi:hypothetical protein
LYKTTKRCCRRNPFIQCEATNHNAGKCRLRSVLLICGSHSNNASKEKMDSCRIWIKWFHLSAGLGVKSFF